MSTKVQVKELESDQPRTKKLEVTIPPEEVEKGLKAVARTLSRYRPIPGFRPGKAPYKLVEQKFGRSYLIEQFLKQHITEIVKATLSEIGLEEAHTPEIIEMEVDEEPLTLTLLVPLPARVDLGDYKSIRQEYHEPEITDEDIEKYLRYILRDKSVWEPTDEPIQKGDEVTLEVTIKVGDEVVIDHETITLEAGRELYLPGLDEAILGMKAGETKTITLPLEEDHMWQEHGEEAEVTVTVQEVKRLRLPEFTPEILEEYFPSANSEEEAREYLRELVTSMHKQEAERAFREHVLNEVVQQSTVEVSPVIVQRLAEYEMEQVENYLKEKGISLEQYLKAFDKTPEEWEEGIRESVQRTLSEDLVLEKIMEEAELEVTRSDMEEAIIEMSNEMGISPTSFVELLKENKDLADNVRRRALRIRVTRYLADIARGRLEEAPEEEASQETAGEPTPEETPQGEEERTPEEQETEETEEAEEKKDE